jgi:hypothetical protein
MRYLYVPATLLSIAAALMLGFLALRHTEPGRPAPAPAVADCVEGPDTGCGWTPPSGVSRGSATAISPGTAAVDDAPPLVFLMPSPGGDDGVFLPAGTAAAVVALVETEAGEAKVRAEVDVDNRRRARLGLAAILVVDMRAP